MKSGFAVTVGRPSCGKSTLINTLCGHKVSIVSSVPQTTRRPVRGIANREEGQIVFSDMPGFHLSGKEFNRALNDLDATRMPGDEEEALAELLSQAGVFPVFALNKIDAVDDAAVSIEAYQRFLSRFWTDAEVLPVSALRGEGTQRLFASLFARLEEGPPLYPEDYYTDQPPDFRIAEIIREKAMNRLSEELPHSIYVEVADWEMPSDNELWIRAFICVEKESQKGMVVGKDGVKIGAIRKAAKRELKSVFPQNIRLDLRVKVSKNWRKNGYQIKSVLGLNKDS